MAGVPVESKLVTTPACVPEVIVTSALATTSLSDVETEEKREERVRGLADTLSTDAVTVPVKRENLKYVPRDLPVTIFDPVVPKVCVEERLLKPIPPPDIESMSIPKEYQVPVVRILY